MHGVSMLILSHLIKMIQASCNGKRTEQSNVNKKIKIFFTVVGFGSDIIKNTLLCV